MKFTFRWLASLLLGILASCGATRQYSFAQAASGPEILNAVPICSETVVCIITAVSDPAGVFQVGTGSTWCLSTFTNPTPLPLTVNLYPSTQPFCAVDPVLGTAKMLVAQQKATAWTVNITVAGVAQQVTIPALVALPTPTVYSPTYRAGNIYPIAFSKISVITGSPAAAVLATFPIPAYQFVAGVLQNFNMTVNIGVVPFNCTYASTTTAGIITMNCSPAQK